MAEFVLGLGIQKSVREVVALVEPELVRTEGVPKRIRIHAGPIEVVAERPDYSGDFTVFALRLRTTEKCQQKIRTVVEEYSDCSTLGETDDVFEVHCPPAGIESSARSLEAVDKVSACVTLPEVWRVEGDRYRTDPISAELIFQAMIQYKASDVHLSPGLHPVFRIDNETRHSDLLGDLTAQQIFGFIREIAPERFWKEFEEDKQTSFSYHQAGIGFSRVSAFVKSGSPHCTLRFLPEVVPSFEDLNIPADTMQELAGLHRGLLLVAGMTGSGKTTTVAAIIDWINTHRPAHILTIENPIEYVHLNKKAIISQRSLGSDVMSFDAAVTGALRHDPDVLLIGEMRDSDTIRSAINAAATGHLVVSTLHANTASEVINRIVSFFDPVERDLVRLQLRDCLKCVICQRLVPRVGGGRIPAMEVMLNDVKPIGDGIRVGDTDQIRIGMQQSISHSFLFEHYLHTIFKEGKVTLEHGQEFSTDQSIFDQLHMGTYSIPRLEAIKYVGDHASKA